MCIRTWRGQSNLKVLVPDKQWTNPASVKEALDDVGGGRNVQITRLAEVSRSTSATPRRDRRRPKGISDVDMYIRIVQDDDAGVIGHTMIAEDMQAFLRQPWAMVASDGGINTSHPRGAGTFPRVLGRFVRDEKWLSLPDAIKKMTSMPAARLKLKDRGTIAIGMKADLMLFDPNDDPRSLDVRATTAAAARHLPRLRQRAPGVDGRLTRGRAAWRAADSAIISAPEDCPSLPRSSSTRGPCSPIESPEEASPVP